MNAQTHKWAIAWEPVALKALRKLPNDVRQAVFDALPVVLRADNACHAPGVCKIVKDGQYRIHADAASYPCRVKFVVVPGKIIVQEFEYKGVVVVRDICKRDESTY